MQVFTLKSTFCFGHNGLFVAQILCLSLRTDIFNQPKIHTLSLSKCQWKEMRITLRKVIYDNITSGGGSNTAFV